MSTHRTATAALLLLSAACTFSGADVESAAVDREERATASAAADSGAGVSISVDGDAKRRGEPTFAEGPGGQAWMSTTDGTLMMGIRHDSVLISFSDSLRKAVKTEVDTSMQRDIADEKSAMGRAIGGIVQGTVKAALTEVFDKERGFAISDLRDVRYDNGEIVFSYRDKPMIRPENIKNDDEPMTRRFHPADAARFVGAVRARINAR